ncbi:MAG: hypothetical protein LBS62_14210 [Clostridiales bacterium]|jgi:hypothetical protein|nr:hypothetical protein [Clostridiales bacterium]
MENSVVNFAPVFRELSYEETLYTDGGVDKIVLIGGIIAVGLGIVAIGVSAAVGFCVGGPVGAAAACAKAVAPLILGGVAAIALSFRTILSIVKESVNGT